MVALKELRGRRVMAADCIAGVLSDVHLDPARWKVRYLSVRSGLLIGDEALVVATANATVSDGAIRVNLRRMQMGLRAASRNVARCHSARDIARYCIQASDCVAGELDDILIAPDWSVAALVVATGHWLKPGFRVRLEPRHVRRIDRGRRALEVGLDCEQIRRLPR